nr:MAG: hypothetical protein BEN19_02610 [Epulopiscium sp. Nuni2H_MBin003]
MGKDLTQDSRQTQIEEMLSKAIYDLFAERMKNNIGLLVDFRKSCNTLVKYVFRGVHIKSDQTYHELLIKALKRLQKIDEEDINFDKEILFEREFTFTDHFSLIIGNHIKEILNIEFQWNLFFRILFYIEPEDNAGDLTKFIEFYKYRICKDLDISKLVDRLELDFINCIIEELLVKFANTFVEINLVDLVYDDIIEKLQSIMSKVIKEISLIIFTPEDWKINRQIFFKLLYFRMIALFDLEIEDDLIISFRNELRGINLELPKSLIKYI